MLGSAESKHSRLTNPVIIVEDFPPMSSGYRTSTSQTDGQTDDLP